jgi:hypothetical protein
VPEKAGKKWVFGPLLFGFTHRNTANVVQLEKHLHPAVTAVDWEEVWFAFGCGIACASMVSGGESSMDDEWVLRP